MFRKKKTCWIEYFFFSSQRMALGNYCNLPIKTLPSWWESWQVFVDRALEVYTDSILFSCMETQGLSDLFLDNIYNTKEDLLLTNFNAFSYTDLHLKKDFFFSLERHPEQRKCDGNPSRCLWLYISHCVSALLNWAGALGSQNPCWEVSTVEEGWACLVGGGRTGKSKLCLSCALASTAWDLR